MNAGKLSSALLSIKDYDDIENISVDFLQYENIPCYCKLPNTPFH